MRTFILSLMMLLAAFFSAQANDGVYFTSGNFLVPVHETDISVAKEILTITIGKDSLATVDVQYEFVNYAQAKNVTMAFEATAPYNDLSPLNRKGTHPSIKDFQVCMNGTTLPYRNAVVAWKANGGGHQVDFTPLDLTQWKGYGEVADTILPENNMLYNVQLDSLVAFAYAYYFDAPFQEGINRVHHTYRYRMSYNVMQKFVIPYWLTPAIRWANKQVDDFTLNITSEEPTDFCMVDILFHSAPFKSVKGNKIYQFKDESCNPLLFASLSQGDTIVWHGKDFKPITDMNIESPSWEQDAGMRKWETSCKVVISADNDVSRYIGDYGDSYFVMAQDYGTEPKATSRLVEYDAKNGQGWLILDTDEASKVNIRQKPTTKSRVLCTISAANPCDMPEVYPCLGLVTTRQGDTVKNWYKIKVGNRVGYVSQALMLWNAINGL